MLDLKAAFQYPLHPKQRSPPLNGFNESKIISLALLSVAMHYPSKQSVLQAFAVLLVILAIHLFIGKISHEDDTGGLHESHSPAMQQTPDPQTSLQSTDSKLSARSASGSRFDEFLLNHGIMLTDKYRHTEGMDILIDDLRDALSEGVSSSHEEVQTYKEAVNTLITEAESLQ